MAALAYPGSDLGTTLASTSGEPPQRGFTPAQQFAEHAPIAPWACSGGVAVGDSAYGRKLHKSAGRDDTDGLDAAGCYAVEGHAFLSWPVAVDAGARTITAAIKQPLAGTARASLVVMANKNVGLLADVVATAAVGTGWQTLTCSFTATSAGAVRVQLRNNSGNACKFDDLTVA